jgi:hypothetical protein
VKFKAQPDNSFKLIGEISGEFIFFKPDILGNIFTISSGGQLKKYNSVFDSVAVFNEVKRYGPLQQISSDNPLRTLLYFKNFKTILILDRFMQVVNKVDLRSASLFQVTAAAQSYDNKFWVFDEQDARLKKINETGKVETESGDLRLLAGINPSPDVIFELDKYVCLYDKQNGLVLFDQLGGYRNTIPMTGWKDVHGIGDYVLGVKDNMLFGYSFKNKQSIELLNLSGTENIKGNQLTVCAQRMYIKSDKGIKIYHLPSMAK